MFGKIVTIIYLVIGVYFIYTGIVKKGKLYENTMIEDDKIPLFKKDMSLFLKLSGPVLCVGAIAELAGLKPMLYAGCYVIVILMAMVLIFRMSAYTKKV